MKSRLLNPDYDSDDSLPQDVMNKKNLLIQKFSPSINPKVLIWKVTRLSISLTQPVQQIRLINGMLLQRQILFFNNWWFEINDWWFQYEEKEYHKCKKGTTARKNTHAPNISSVYGTISDNNANIQTNYEKYVNDRLNHSVSSTDRKNTSQYLMDNPSSEFADKDDVTGVKVTNKDFHKVKKRDIWYETQSWFKKRVL